MIALAARASALVREQHWTICQDRDTFRWQLAKFSHLRKSVNFELGNATSVFVPF
jgi:hypothetical protein